MADPRNIIVPTTSLEIQRGNPQISPVPLVWSIAQRISHNLIIQASIEYVTSPLDFDCTTSQHFTALDVAVRTMYRPNVTRYIPTCSILPIGYWRGLSSSQDFTDRPLEDCAGVIHVDIVDVWNLQDRDGVCLSPHVVVLFAQ